MTKIIGIDIGATKMAGGVIVDGKVVKKIKKMTEADFGVERVLDNAVKIVSELVNKNEEIKIGIGIAGQIDVKSGKIIKSPNMAKLNGVNFKELLENKLAEFSVEEITIENDAKCFVLAEAIYGAGEGYKYILGLTIGTGIGAGMVIDGKLYKGQGFASEAGHMMLGEKSFENWASGRAIEKCYGEKIMATEIEKLIEKDKKAKECYETAGKYLGIGIANLINILCPEIIIIGGGLGRSKALIDLAKEEMKKYVFYKDVNFGIEMAKLGDDAGIIGAGMLLNN